MDNGLEKQTKYDIYKVLNLCGFNRVFTSTNYTYKIPMFVTNVGILSVLLQDRKLMFFDVPFADITSDKPFNKAPFASIQLDRTYPASFYVDCGQKVATNKTFGLCIDDWYYISSISFINRGKFKPMLTSRIFNEYMDNSFCPWLSTYDDASKYQDDLYTSTSHWFELEENPQNG